jgi:hypothetical protein
MPADCSHIKLSIDLDINANVKLDAGSLTFHGRALHQAFELIGDDINCLIIDNDAFPLSREAVELTFEMAKKLGISGNLQRTNSIDNGEHIFYAPSYLCINSSLIHGLGSQAWVTNGRSDTAEEIAWIAGKDSTIFGFRPYRNRYKPIWPLEGSRKVYGIGTYFRDQASNLPINYHHFYSRVFIARLDFFFFSLFYIIWSRYCLFDF